MLIYLRQKMKICAVFFSHLFCAMVLFSLVFPFENQSLFFMCQHQRHLLLNMSFSVCGCLASDAQCSPASFAKKGEEECREELGLGSGL